MKFARTSKYKARRTIVDGINFASKAEAEYYLELQTYVKDGELKILELQPTVKMTTSMITYRPDFKVQDKFNRVWYVDVKGVETPVFKLKKKLWKHYGDGELKIVKKSGRSFKLVETILSTNEGL